jgi:phosphatidylserine/phosphatidylglycerophosphate/cardiolipin synthase-like enzyme
MEYVGDCLGADQSAIEFAPACSSEDAEVARTVLEMSCDELSKSSKEDGFDLLCTPLLRPLGLCCKDNGKCPAPEIACASEPGRKVAEAVWNSDTGDGTVPQDILYTPVNAALEPLVDAARIFPAMADMIAAARYEVDLETFEWDPWVYSRDERWRHDATMRIIDGLVRLQERLRDEEQMGRSPHTPVKVHITLDGRHRKAREDAGPLAVNKARNLYRQILNADLDPALVEVHIGVHERRLWGALHSKVLVVDGYNAMVTGANAQRFNTLGNSWHDIGYRVKGTIGIALQANFDDTWKESGEVTSCSLENLEADAECEVVSTKAIHHVPEVRVPALFDDPDLDPSTCLPMVAATRRAYDVDLVKFDFNNPNNPQDQAFIAMMQNAQSLIKIESPNVNDDRAKQEMLDAVERGVDVRIIMSLGFNAAAERRKEGPFEGGGANVDTVEDLLARLGDPAKCERLQMRWNSKNGTTPTWVQEPGSSHAKYMTVDGQLAMVGSANQDNLSWNLIRESNVVIDSSEVTALYDQRVFDRDWERAIDVLEWARTIRDGELEITPALQGLLQGDAMGWAQRVTQACGI